MTLSAKDVLSHVQPRFSSRRERKPGARERHSLQRCRLSPEPHSYLNRSTPSPRPHTVQPQSAYELPTSARPASGWSALSQANIHEEEIQTSHYKELSTIEDIRADVKATEKKGVTRKHNLPDWMLELDINLDVSAVDIVPPFEADLQQEEDETYYDQPTLTMADELESDSDSQFGELQTEKEVLHHQVDLAHQFNQCIPQKGTEGLERPLSRTQDRPASRTRHTFRTSPRRYQGDKRVMSLQQGGIRSTPMQPKAKKFINQMITYQHMKVHDKKLKKAKPAVDTKMPSTFKIALDRKRLVETRLSESGTGSVHTPSSSSRASLNPSRTQETTSR